MPILGIDGLASGLDTTAIINQLMAVERQPVVRLQNRLSANDLGLKALQDLEGKLRSLGTAAGALSSEAAATFAPLKATSSAPHVVASASSGAVQGAFSFSVEQLATVHRLASSGTTANLTDVVATAGSTVDVVVGGSTYSAATGDGSLSALIAGINAAAGEHVVAQAVQTGSGYRLQVSARSSGVDAAFTIDGANVADAFDGGLAQLATVSQGQDAAILVGSGPGAYTVTSASNTFNDVVAGTSFTVTEARPGDEVTVTVATDPDALVQRIKALVDAANTVLGDIDAATKNDPKGAKGPLVGDASVRRLRDQVVAAVSYGVAGSTLGSAGVAGIELQRNGTFAIDVTVLRDAIADDPDGITALFRSDDPAEPGVAQRVRALVEDVTTLNTGALDAAIDGLTRRKRLLDEQVAAFDVRLELRRTKLQRQFSALEVALSRTQSQGQWLAGQLGSLPSKAG